jgi:hypothetical protein
MLQLMDGWMNKIIFRIVLAIIQMEFGLYTGLEDVFLVLVQNG